MKTPLALALFGALALASPANAAVVVGNAATDRNEVDSCSACTFVINQAFGVAGLSLNSFTLFAERAGDITPLLFSRNDVGTTATFTVLGVGQQRTAVAGVNTFSFDAQDGTDLTAANSYFGFSYPGLGVVSFDYTSTSPSAGTFVGSQNAALSAVGQSFTADFSTPQDNAFNGLNNRTYSISASAVPEPATWAMMIGGFGLIGGAMRRRARVSVSVSYA